MSDVNSMPTIPELETEAKNLSQQLTPNQALFCTEYLKDRNGTRAYQRAYPNCKSENAAAVNATKLLRNANKVDAFLKIEFEIIRRKHQITVENLRKEESAICFSDIRKVRPDDEWLNSLPEKVAKSVSTYKVKEKPIKIFDEETKKWVWKTEFTYEIKLWDKGAALGRMERHMGMFIDRTELTGPGGGAITIDDITRNELARRVAFIFNRAIYEGKKKGTKT